MSIYKLLANASGAGCACAYLYTSQEIASRAKRSKASNANGKPVAGPADQVEEWKGVSEVRESDGA